MKFRDHKYTWRRSFSAVEHQWSFRGPLGGIHFTATIMDEAEKYGGPSCGLEFHHAFDPSGGQEAPHHSPCWLLGGPCWHDGTSLYANEALWPRIVRMLEQGDHLSIFKYLENIYCDHFEPQSEDAP